MDAARAPGARYAPAALVAMRLNCDIVDDLRTVRGPLLLLWGERATRTPFRESVAVRAARPDAPFVALPDGDLPHHESVAAFLETLIPFLGQRPAAH